MAYSNYERRSALGTSLLSSATGRGRPASNGPILGTWREFLSRLEDPDSTTSGRGLETECAALCATAQIERDVPVAAPASTTQRAAKRRTIRVVGRNRRREPG
jgi:hypothetical protein